MNKYNIVIGNHTGLQPITDYILYIKDWISQSNKHSEIEIIVTPKIAPNYHNFVIEPSVDISSNEDFDENFSINLASWNSSPLLSGAEPLILFSPSSPCNFRVCLYFDSQVLLKR